MGRDGSNKRSEERHLLRPETPSATCYGATFDSSLLEQARQQTEEKLLTAAIRDAYKSELEATGTVNTEFLDKYAKLIAAFACDDEWQSLVFCLEYFKQPIGKLLETFSTRMVQIEGLDVFVRYAQLVLLNCIAETLYLILKTGSNTPEEAKTSLQKIFPSQETTNLGKTLAAEIESRLLDVICFAEVHLSLIRAQDPEQPAIYWAGLAPYFVNYLSALGFDTQDIETNAGGQALYRATNKAIFAVFKPVEESDSDALPYYESVFIASLKHKIFSGERVPFSRFALRCGYSVLTHVANSFEQIMEVVPTTNTGEKLLAVVKLAHPQSKQDSLLKLFFAHMAENRPKIKEQFSGEQSDADCSVLAMLPWLRQQDRDSMRACAGSLKANLSKKVPYVFASLYLSHNVEITIDSLSAQAMIAWHLLKGVDGMADMASDQNIPADFVGKLRVQLEMSDTISLVEQQRLLWWLYGDWRLFSFLMQQVYSTQSRSPVVAQTRLGRRERQDETISPPVAPLTLGSHAQASPGERPLKLPETIRKQLRSTFKEYEFSEAIRISTTFIEKWVSGNPIAAKLYPLIKACVDTALDISLIIELVKKYLSHGIDSIIYIAALGAWSVSRNWVNYLIYSEDIDTRTLERLQHNMAPIQFSTLRAYVAAAGAILKTLLQVVVTYTSLLQVQLLETFWPSLKNHDINSYLSLRNFHTLKHGIASITTNLFLLLLVSASLICFLAVALESAYKANAKELKLTESRGVMSRILSSFAQVVRPIYRRPWLATTIASLANFAQAVTLGYALGTRSQQMICNKYAMYTLYLAFIPWGIISFMLNNATYYVQKFASFPPARALVLPISNTSPADTSDQSSISLFQKASKSNWVVFSSAAYQAAGPAVSFIMLLATLVSHIPGVAYDPKAYCDRIDAASAGRGVAALIVMAGYFAAAKLIKNKHHTTTTLEQIKQEVPGLRL